MLCDHVGRDLNGAACLLARPAFFRKCVTRTSRTLSGPCGSRTRPVIDADNGRHEKRRQQRQRSEGEIAERQYPSLRGKFLGIARKNSRLRGPFATL